jgi:hypothetical protein
MKNISKLYIIAFFSSVIFSFFFVSSSLDAVQPSRNMMVVAEQIVREKKPTPTQSSRFYAIVAKEYYTTTYNTNKEYKYSTSSLESVLKKVIKQDSQEILAGERPVGVPYWVSDKKPFSPNAGKAERFVIDSSFSYQVPKPPLYGGDEFKKALQIVKEASGGRTLEQGAAINFWGGVPGTEAPAGIWQNRLYEVTKKYNLSDKEYAYAQMVLAESVADAFMECWKVKYTYWTKRPDMTDTTIAVAMPNPPFPGYVSGHSTISFTAATVLGALFPKDKEIFLSDAEEAKNSRLWAGIHFPYDNEEGEKLGKAVGEFVVKKLTLKSIK